MSSDACPCRSVKAREAAVPLPVQVRWRDFQRLGAQGSSEGCQPSPSSQAERHDPLCKIGRVSLTGPNQLWVADITSIAVSSRFVYIAAGLDV